MELKYRKRIKNGLPGFIDGFDVVDKTWYSGKSLPFLSIPSGLAKPLNPKDLKPLDLSYENGGTKPSSAAGIALGEWIGSGIGAGINAYLGSDDIVLGAGTSTGYVNGMSYLKGNDIDTQQLRRDYNKDTAMSFLTNPFKGLTMLFSHNKQMRAIRNAAKEQQARNTAAMAGASTNYLQQEYSKEHGDPTSQILYAKNGKDAVHTSEGEFNIMPNSKTEGGEIVYNKQKGTAHVIPGKASGDNNYSSILPSDTIISNKFGLASRGRNAAKALESLNKKKANRGSLADKTDELIKSQATAVLDDLANEQKAYRDLGMLPQPGMKKYKNGKLSNWWIDGLGALSSVGNLISDATLRIKRPNTDVEPNDALDVLASLRINQYPINKQINDQLRRNLYANDRIGLLSSSQKAYANIASGLGALSTIAESNANTQKQNNLFFSDYAKYASSFWKDRALAKTQTNRWNLDYYSKAHAAKQQMVQQGFYNMLAALQQGYANSWKRYSFDKMMNLYDNSYA